jgi:hypothetical protein
METLAHSKFRIGTVEKDITVKKKVKAFWAMLEFNRFGVVAWVLSVVACFSGIVAGLFLDGSNQFQTTLIIAPTMLTLCMILAVAPIRVILAVGIGTIIIDLLMILFSVL